MEQNYSQEIDALKGQMENLQNTVLPQLDELRAMILELLPNKASTEKLKRVHVMHGMHPDSRLSEQMEELCYKTEATGASGLVTYLGVYNSGGRQSNWIRNSVPADDLLSLIESGVAGKVLACIGNANRLALLLDILRGPKTVTSLVEKCAACRRYRCGRCAAERRLCDPVPQGTGRNHAASGHQRYGG